MKTPPRVSRQPRPKGEACMRRTCSVEDNGRENIQIHSGRMLVFIRVFATIPNSGGLEERIETVKSFF